MHEHGADIKQGCILYHHHEAGPVSGGYRHEIRGRDGTAFPNCTYGSAAVYNGSSRYGKMVDYNTRTKRRQVLMGDVMTCGKRNVTMLSASVN